MSACPGKGDGVGGASVGVLGLPGARSASVALVLPEARLMPTLPGRASMLTDVPASDVAAASPVGLRLTEAEVPPADALALNAVLLEVDAEVVRLVDWLTGAGGRLVSLDELLLSVRDSAGLGEGGRWWFSVVLEVLRVSAQLDKSRRLAVVELLYGLYPAASEPPPWCPS